MLKHIVLAVAAHEPCLVRGRDIAQYLHGFLRIRAVGNVVAQKRYAVNIVLIHPPHTRFERYMVRVDVAHSGYPHLAAPPFYVYNKTYCKYLLYGFLYYYICTITCTANINYPIICTLISCVSKCLFPRPEPRSFRPAGKIPHTADIPQNVRRARRCRQRR